MCATIREGARSWVGSPSDFRSVSVSLFGVLGILGVCPSLQNEIYMLIRLPAAREEGQMLHINPSFKLHSTTPL